MNLLIKNIAFLTLMLLVNAAKGQYLSQKGWFTVDEIKGCAGLTINITFVPGAAPCICGDAGCPCDFDYNGDGAFDQNSSPLTYTFTTPGNYTLEILFPNPNGSDFIDIQIKDNIAPEFDIYSCSGETIVIDITDNNFDNYVINYGDGTNQTIANGSVAPQHTYPDSAPRTVEVRGLNDAAADNCVTGTDDVVPVMSIPQPAITSLIVVDNSTLVMEYSLQPDILYELQVAPSGNGNYNFLKYVAGESSGDTIRDLNLTENYFCFRIASRDPCNNTVATYSNTICSIDLALAIENDVNKLTWQTADPDVNFSLQRDDLLTQPVVASARSYDDVDVVCDVDYCYTLVAHYADGYTSTSLPQCGTAFSTTPPEPVNNISTIVSGNTIAVTWEEPQNITEYQLRKIGSGSTFIVSQTNSFQDTLAAPSEQSYCYQIQATDACGNTTVQGITGCSLFLTGVAANDNTIQLSWNEYTGWENGVAHFLVEKSYPSGGTSVVNTNTNAFSDTDANDNEQMIRYRVIAVANDAGLQRSVSNTVIIIKPVNIYYPDAFTPDGNGLNEVFKINGKFIVSYQLRIYNRWGELIFTSNDINEGWDGTTNGKILPQGTYAFVCDMRDMAGREHTRTGTILLLRR